MAEGQKDSGAVVIVLVAIGAALYLRSSGAFDEGGLLGPRKSSGSAGPGLPATNPYAEAIKAAAPTIQQAGKDLFRENSDLRRRLKQHGDAYQNILARTPIGKSLGVKKPGERKAFATGLKNQAYARRLDLERWAGKMHALLARPDVEQWQLTSDLTFYVWFRGIAKPHKEETPKGKPIINQPRSKRGGLLGKLGGVVPKELDPLRLLGSRDSAYASGISTLEPRDRQAYAAEPIVRALGSFVQAGRRFGTPFIRHDPPAYSDANPFANSDETVSGLKRIAEEPLSQIETAKEIQDRIGSTGIRPSFIPTHQDPDYSEEEAA